jgi:ABC-type branched-subunit amino acid transport system ATPase component
MTGQADPVILRTDAVTMLFGGFTALSDITVEVRKGDIHSIIGPNGAGKTTFFNLVTGVLHPNAGEILFEGAALAKTRPNARTARGMARTFQNVRLFEDMTVLENIQVAQHCRHFTTIAQALRHALFHHRVSQSAPERAMREAAAELLDFVGLGPIQDRNASNLPYGERRLLEIARALATEPRLLLLDEPGAGMNPVETAKLDTLINLIRDRGVTVLLVEHDMNFVMGISDRITVFNFGEKIAEGAPSEIQRNEDVIVAYLGSESTADS